MSWKNANQPARKESDELNAKVKDLFREIHLKMKWTRDDPDIDEQKFWLRMAIFYCEGRIKYLSRVK